MNYTAREIAEITDSEIIGNKDAVIRNIAYDSRNIFTVKNTAFITINTQNNSGEKYIASAVEKGINIIISENYHPDFKDITWVIVENSIAFLQKLAQKHLEHSALENIIGITGSNGKTIVKEWLYQCLWDEISVVKSPKSFNSQIGLPISLLQINDTHRLGIFEAGISRPKEMDVLAQIFSPKIGILTHIGTAHSSNFQNETELIAEKIKLFKSSETIIYNGDNDWVEKAIQQNDSNQKLIRFGLDKKNDIYITSDYKNPDEEIRVKYFKEELIFPVRQRDKATLSNLLAVISVLKELKFSNEQIITKIKRLQSVEMRLESINGIKNNIIINDSYNLDFDSLTIAYQFVKQYKKINKTLILTDILETSEADETLYPKVAKITNEQNFSQVFLIGNRIIKYRYLFSAPTQIFDNTEDFIGSQYIHYIENQLILLKGARIFKIEKIKKLLELQKHDTTLEVNLNSIIHNINIHKNLLKPETKICAMVKAYSYGLGGYEIAEFLQHHHIDYLGVAYADEGVDLRKNGITTPILVMNPEQSSYDTIIDYQLEPEIYSFRVLGLFVNQLQSKGIQEKYPIHLKIETGMHRLGFKENEIPLLIEKLSRYNIKVVSIFSHLSSADLLGEKDYTLAQLETFEQISNQIISGIGYKPIRHILNSAGIVNYTDYQYDMVRIGIGMLGISNCPKIKEQLQNVATFKTVISQISEIKKGESIGYSRKYIAEKDIKIATIPVGYADGIPRLLGNQKGWVYIKDKKLPIMGNVCMDMMMINIDGTLAKEGDEIVVFDSIKSLESFAKASRTIPYEVLTSISRRVKRIYVRD